MPSTADATLLFSPAFSDRFGDGGDCGLDTAGAVTALGTTRAMIEPRTHAASTPSCGLASADADAVATERRPCLAPSDDLFQKFR